MMTPKAVKDAERLLAERSRIATTKWNAIVDDQNLRPQQGFGSSGSFALKNPEAADEELCWAIEEFRKRKLEAIDGQLRELGVDPSASDE